MTYKEELPSQCPPDDATDKPLPSVCRFFPFPESDPRNFFSHHKLGKRTGNASECRAKSISLFKTGAVPDLLAAKRTAFFKKCKIGLLNVPEGAGHSKESGNGHVDWWPFAEFDPFSSVVCVCESADDLKQAVEDAS
ncbi:hypothetical protein [Celeribacter halophilus]|uniref:hypothetical protein n=1 Tax=Celeribacter halophilus TaxID=576117 RepID=UPI00111389C7|nr:hypothetical protein [Celeribacter halophilus]